MEERYRKLEAENYHLKRQLSKVHKERRSLIKTVKYWKYKALNEHKEKQHYRNGKRGNRNGR